MAFEKLAAGLAAVIDLTKGVTQAVDDAAKLTHGSLDDMTHTIEILTNDVSKAHDQIDKALTRVLVLTQKTVKATDDATTATQDAVEKTAGHWNTIGNKASETALIVKTAVEDVQSSVSTGDQLLEDMVAHQKDRITAIEGTAFGGYLDQYKQLIELQQTFNGSTDPREIVQVNETLQDIRRIIHDWTGKAGQDFNFDQFKQDILTLLSPTGGLNLAGMIPRVARAAGKPIGDISTGSAGSPPANSTTQFTLGLSLAKGALR